MFPSSVLDRFCLSTVFFNFTRKQYFELQLLRSSKCLILNPKPNFQFLIRMFPSSKENAARFSICMSVTAGKKKQACFRFNNTAEPGLNNQKSGLKMQVLS